MDNIYTDFKKDPTFMPGTGFKPTIRMTEDGTRPRPAGSPYQLLVSLGKATH